MKRLAVVLATAVLASLVCAGAALAQSGPEFRLGFKALADQVPDVVGEPLEEEHYGPNGDSLQRTTTGLMVWRKADNWTAFTDGHRTWVNGPYGVQDRLNTERFEWEAAAPPPAAPDPPSPPPPPPATPMPTVAPVRYSPDVRAMDEESAGPGVLVKQWMREIDAEWERTWGWKPSRPTTIYLYFDGYRMIDDMAVMSGEHLDAAAREAWALGVHGVAIRDERSGGWSVLANLSHGYGWSDWEIDTKSMLAHEYVHVMQLDVAGEAGPAWFIEGMAQLCAYAFVPEAAAASIRLAVTSSVGCLDQLPSLRSLNDSWAVVVTLQTDLAYGVSYFALKHLADRVGGRPLLEVLERTAGGQDFEIALEEVTGFSLERLDSEYRQEVCEAYR